MGKTNILYTLFIFLLITTLVACGGGDSDADKEVESEEIETEEEEVVEEDIGEEESGNVADGDIFNPAIAEETEGNVELVYTNEDAGFVNDIDGFIIKAHEYQIIKVTDMNERGKNRFDGNADGYVVTTKASIENTRESPIQNFVNMNIQMDDQFDYLASNTKYYIPEEHQLTWDDSEEIGIFEPGVKKEFWLTTRMSTEEFEKLETIEPKFIIEGRINDLEGDEGLFDNHDKVFDFIFSDEQAAAVADSPDFYPDRLTTDNIAKKELIFEDKAIGETDELDGYEITVEGVQYTEITPNESSEERFENFDDDDLVALTVHITHDNQSDETISSSGLSAWLVVNDGESRIQNQGMVEYASLSEVGPGDTGENYIVFLMKEKYYDIYETFELEIGPFLGDDGYAFKERKMKFTLPSE